MFLKNKNIIFKIRRSKVTEYAALKGYSSQKPIDFFLNPFCIKLVTFHFSPCNFAIVYLYKEIKSKPRFKALPHPSPVWKF